MTDAKTIDLHGLTRAEAKAAIDAALGASAGLKRLALVHGYHSGQALKDMIDQTYRNHPRVLRVARGSNPGETYLILKP